MTERDQSNIVRQRLFRREHERHPAEIELLQSILIELREVRELLEKLVQR